MSLSFDDLSFLIELYGRTGKNVTALSLFLSTFSKKLSGNQGVGEMNEMIKQGKFYLTFQDEMKEGENIQFWFPKNSLGRIFEFEFFSDEILEMFEGKSLMQLLKYY